VKALEREPDERELIEAAQADPSRFAGLYDRNFERVYAFFARRVSTREEAQDLTPEVFHQALVSLSAFRWQVAPFIAWFYGIAANILSGHWRNVGISCPLQDFDLRGASGEIERSLALAQLVESRSPDQRLVIRRRFIDQRSIREIAQELGRSEGAIKQLLLRALENLRAKLRRKP
jgi:RNA polymerase sigma-70 factor, ECF subfamily